MSTERRGSPPSIHPSAVIGPEADLADGVEIGPFCLIQGNVRIGRGTRLISHITIFGSTEIGENNIFHPHAVIGGEPQDTAYTGGPRSVKIGNRNVFREGTTVNRGCEKGDITIIGDDNLLMVNSHVGHDCRLGSGIIIVNGSLLGGWVEVGDSAFISGNCAVHQFCRIGRLSMISGVSTTSRDLPPFCIMESRHELKGINVVGLRRAGFTVAQIAALRRAYNQLFGRRHNMAIAMEHLVAEGPSTPEVAEMIEFIRSSKRGVVFPPLRLARSEDEPED